MLPFESVKGSIEMLFNPILEGKESANYWLLLMEIIFIKAHRLLFIDWSSEDFVHCTQKLFDGDILDNYIGCITDITGHEYCQILFKRPIKIIGLRTDNVYMNKEWFPICFDNNTTELPF